MAQNNDPAASGPETQPGTDAERIALQQTLHHGHSPFAPVSHPGRLEWVFLWACKLIILAMIGIIGTELVTRNLFGFSFQLSDEFGGYLLAALAFFSLSVCQSHGYFHRVDFVQARLSELGQAVSMVIFDLLSLAFSVILFWQMFLLEHGSWQSGELASTILMTPLWIPQIALPIGAAALCIAVAKSLAMNLVWLAGAIGRRWGAR
ncbi:TRAP transporter small permease [Paraburkholderia sp. FT54]|jgi:TRAP-type C4-dicarboxylate transport system permease small subunit|uniref:TRAP transporter small permease n=1 Tax=Paraburkholderia sp. FT54 TaxID=3074437 RepID=UPI00287748AF|nr:TRAP transporter small permease [Paraburkholderia sp. FT54]WNC93522.1 TRAP transporter small permease [Paraburkholderia sp. FT54]